MKFLNFFNYTITKNKIKALSNMNNSPYDSISLIDNFAFLHKKNPKSQIQITRSTKSYNVSENIK